MFCQFTVRLCPSDFEICKPNMKLSCIFTYVIEIVYVVNCCLALALYNILHCISAKESLKNQYDDLHEKDLCVLSVQFIIDIVDHNQSNHNSVLL